MPIPQDYIVGSESDSGLRLDLTCPVCRLKHRVALTRLDGRFAYACGPHAMTGQVDNWAEFKKKAKEKADDAHVRGAGSLG